MSEPSPEPMTPALLTATLAVSLSGGMLLIISELASLPVAFVILGLVLFLVGLGLALVIGFVDARRTGQGLLRSFGHGLVTLWRWLWAVMP